MVEIDCRTGVGIDELLAITEQLLGPALGAPFTEVIEHQRRQAPAVHAQRVCVRIADQLAELMPVSAASQEEAGKRLVTAVEGVLGLLPAGPGRDRAADELTRAKPSVAEGLCTEVTRPILETRSRPVYEDVPVYETVREIDYDRPKYKSEPVYEWQTVYEDVSDISEFFDGISGLLDGEGFRVPKRRKVLVRYEDVVVGYKKSDRQVLRGTERRHTRTETWQEQVGTEVVDVAIAPLGAPGAAFGLAACAVALDPAAQFDETMETAMDLLDDVLAEHGDQPDLPTRHSAVAAAVERLALREALVRLVREDDRPAGSHL